MATLDPVPYQPGGQSTLSASPKVPAYSPSWWTNANVSNIPSEAVSWLVAQGWTITNVTYDSDTEPPTPYYSLNRKSLQNWQILQTLIVEYTNAYNEARVFNEARYNEVIQAWSNMLLSSQTVFNLQAANHSGYITIYIDNLETYMEEVDDAIEENRTALTTANVAVEAKLTEYDGKLAAFETNYTAHLAKIELLLTSQTDALATYLSDYSTKLTALESAYTACLSAIGTEQTNLGDYLTSHAAEVNSHLDALMTSYDAHEAELDALITAADEEMVSHAATITSLLGTLLTDYNTLDDDITALLVEADALIVAHAADYQTVVGYLSSDYTTHESTAEAFLVDLGTTELARITEAFNNALAAETQKLVDRGFYSSAMTTDITTRNTREKNEAISALNDKLAREKLENEHTLYQQQVAMRHGTLTGKDHVYALKQDVLRYEIDSANRLYTFLREVRERNIATRERLHAAQEAWSRLEMDLRVGLQNLEMDVRTRTIAGKERVYNLRDALYQWRAGNKFKLEAELVGVRGAEIDSVQKSLAAREAVYGAAAQQRDKLLNQIHEALGLNLDGRQKFVQLKTSNAEWISTARKQFVEAKLVNQARWLNKYTEVYDKDFKLQAYQLSERNNMLVGLFGWVKDRVDAYPQFDQLVQLTTGLGDSGGGWVSP